MLTNLVPIGAGRPLAPGIDGAWDRNTEESVQKLVQAADAGVRFAGDGVPLRDMKAGKGMPLHVGDSTRTGQRVTANSKAWARCCHDSKASSARSLARQR